MKGRKSQNKVTVQECQMKYDTIDYGTVTLTLKVNRYAAYSSHPLYCLHVNVDNYTGKSIYLMSGSVEKCKSNLNKLAQGKRQFPKSIKWNIWNIVRSL